MASLDVHASQPLMQSLTDAAQAARALANAIEGELRLDPRDRLLYATDASIYQHQPMGVIIPRSLDDVVAAVRVCNEHALPILPRGGGTSLAGQCVNHAVVFDLSPHCCGVDSLDQAARRCTVQVGTTIDDLNDEITHTGLFFAPDPSTSRQATIGGCIGNNAAGARSIMYGRTTENLLGIEACLADGRVVHLEQGAALRDPIAAQLTQQVAQIVRTNAALIRERFPKTLRRNAGYALDTMLDQLEAAEHPDGFDTLNLSHLLCGSEGTLALSLRADLLLHPIPKCRGLAVLAFETLDDAMDALLPLLELHPSAVELLDELILTLARDNIEYRRYVDLLPTTTSNLPPAAVLYVEMSAASSDELSQRMNAIVERFPTAAIFDDATQIAQAWKLRKAGEPLLHAIPGSKKPLGFVEDNVVPPERLAEFVKRGRAIIAKENTRASFYAHASVGVLHVRPLLDLRSADDREAMERIALSLADLARELGGVMSGEHGDGRARGPLLERHFGPELMAAFGDIKRIFDPNGLLNPGNIVTPGPIESIHHTTRIKPATATATIPPVETFFDYSDQDGFAHAVERCNGAGVCRKKAGGTMCPSYMATLDERHSTRGRGNALRLAISGQLGTTEDDSSMPKWDDEHTMQTLDLCLSCKACKSECPSNVDIARLKAEFTAQRFKDSGTPVRAWIMGHACELLRAASLSPGVVNWINTAPLSRRLIDVVLGTSPKRPLPRIERSAEAQWKLSNKPESAPTVLLYVDSFANYTQPGLVRDATDLLAAFGYHIEPFWGTDAGRAFISTGLLPQAINRAQHESKTLQRKLDETGAIAVLFVEPSVLSAVTDDWLELRTKIPAAQRKALAERCDLVEHFLSERWDEHPRTPTFEPGSITTVLFHGHCHQKALWGMQSGADLLEHAFPGRVELLDTTCCGMAGSFGYARDRYDLSMKIAELGVLPAARRAQHDTTGSTVLAAPGTSCRHQVHDGADVRAEHPITLVARAVVGERTDAD